MVRPGATPPNEVKLPCHVPAMLNRSCRNGAALCVLGYLRHGETAAGGKLVPKYNVILLSCSPVPACDTKEEECLYVT